MTAQKMPHRKVRQNKAIYGSFYKYAEPSASKRIFNVRIHFVYTSILLYIFDIVNNFTSFFSGN